MSIKIEKLITIEEVKESEFFNPNDEENEIWSDNYILEAISIATMNMTHWTGGSLMKQIKTLNDEDQNLIKFACLKYVFHLLRKGLEYMRGQSSSTLGGASWSMSNPEDPYYVPPEVQIALKQTGLLIDMYLSNTKTPLTDLKRDINYNLDYNDMDGNTFTPSVREANAWYVRYDRVFSPDNSIVYDNGGDIDKKILNLSINLKNTKLSDLIDKEIDKWKAGVVVDIKNDILNDNGFSEAVEAKMKKWLENDANFKNTLENSITKLIQDDNIFTDNVVQKIVQNNQPDYTKMLAEASAPVLESNETFLDNLSKNKFLLDDLSKQDTLINNLIQVISAKLDGGAIIGEIRAFGETDKTVLEKKGWRQLEIENGHTLVNAFDNGQKIGFTTPGHIAKHTHTITDPGHNHNLEAEYVNLNEAPWKSDFKDDFSVSPSIRSDSDTNRVKTGIIDGARKQVTDITIDEAGLNSDNLPAGLFVNYYIYDPNKEYDLKTGVKKSDKLDLNTIFKYISTVLGDFDPTKVDFNSSGLENTIYSKEPLPEIEISGTILISNTIEVEYPTGFQNLVLAPDIKTLLGDTVLNLLKDKEADLSFTDKIYLYANNQSLLTSFIYISFKPGTVLGGYKGAYIPWKLKVGGQ